MKLAINTAIWIACCCVAGYMLTAPLQLVALDCQPDCVGTPQIGISLSDPQTMRIMRAH